MVAFATSPMPMLDAWRRAYGSAFTVRSPGLPPLVFLSDPSEAMEVFSAPAHVLRPGEGGSVIMPIVGEHSFMLADEDEHIRGRRMLRHAFAASTAAAHAASVRQAAEVELKRWPRDRPIAVHPLLRAFALRTIVRTIFGDGDKRVEALVDQLLAMLEMTASLVLPAPPSRNVPPFRGVWRRFLRERTAVDALLYELIADRRRAPQRSDDTLGQLIDARTQNGAPLPDVYVRDTIMSVVLAGHETTSSALTWAFQLLAHNPDAQRRAAAAVGSGDAARPRGGDYLAATINEVLRHRPVFLFAIPRAVAEPVRIGPRLYEPGAHLLSCIYLLHHDGAAYEDPHTFRPERFLGDARHDPSFFLPWGGGRKRCPGRHLALIEMRAILEAALTQVTVEPAWAAGRGARWRSVIVTPRTGGRVILRARTSRPR